MKMKNVKIKNFKGIKLVDVSTETNMIYIYGQNGAGKSSFCDAIMTALSGKDGAIIRPIRDGEQNASIEIELDGYIVKQSFSQTKAPMLTVTPSGKAVSIKSPRSWLNSHIGNLKFDPSEFSKMDEGKQRELLMELANIDLTENDIKIKELYDERTIIGRELKLMPAPTAEEIALASLYKDKKEVDVSELMNQLNAGTIQRQNFLAAEQKRDVNIKRISELENEILRLKEENKSLELLKDTEVDIDNIKNRIFNSGEENKMIQNSRIIQQKIEDREKKEEEYNTKESWLEIERKKKKEKLDNAKYPIEGLSVCEDGVMYNGVPFSQISDSQKIVIGTLIALAIMPNDNPIKLIFIKFGSLLDEKAISYLEKVAKEKDAQFVLEIVGDNNKGFHIVEGEINNEQ